RWAARQASPIGGKAPARRPAWVNGGRGRRSTCGDPKDRPWRGAGRGRAVVGGERHAGLVDSGGPARSTPLIGQRGNHRPIRHLRRLTPDDEVELMGGQAQRASGVSSQVPALERLFT